MDRAACRSRFGMDDGPSGRYRWRLGTRLVAVDVTGDRIEARCRTSSHKRNPRERHLTRGNATRQFPRCAWVRNDGRPPPEPGRPLFVGHALPALKRFQCVLRVNLVGLTMSES